LRTLGIRPPKEFGLWTKKGAAWLTSLEFDHSLHSVKRTMLVEELETHSKHIRLVEQELEQFSQDNPAVQILMTIPGVGLRTAEAVVAFIDDPHRFPNSKRLGSYFGLVPSQDQSGRTNRLGHITKEGAAVVRAMLTEAVWQAVRRSPTVKSFQQRVQRGDPDRRKISVIATAHYLVRVMWAMLKNGSLWKEQVPLTTAA
jgi:transposase